MKYSNIGIVITRKCNAKCRICCFECSPSREEIIDVDAVEKFIESSRDEKRIETISFSGGEATLHMEVLKKLVSKAIEADKSVTLLTNASWANTMESAASMIKQLRGFGISQIGISYDEFHQEYIDVENVRNYVSAMKRNNMTPIIQTVIGGNADLNWLQKLGVSLCDVVINFIPCYEVGNASNETVGALPKDYDSRECYCRKTETFSVLYDGSVLPCCSPFAQKTILCVGNVFEQSVNDSMKKLNSNIFLKNLRQNGFGFFLDIIDAKGLNINYPERVNSSCELCSVLFSKDNAKLLLPHLI